MKIREDFVSNSSSSSYVVAIDFGKYDFDLFVERTLDRCCGTSYRPDRRRSPAEDVRRANEAVLRSGMMQECLYLGNPVVGRIKEVWKRGEKYDHTMTKRGESDEYTPFKELTDKHRITGKGDTVRYLDENTIEYEYDENLPAWMSVPHDVMLDGIRHNGRLMHGSRPFWRNDAKTRAKRIIEYVRQKQKEVIRRPELNVFRITLNTLRNTRDLAEAGCEILLKPPIAVSKKLLFEFLDKIEFRIRSGETFIFAVAGDAGEGQMDNRLYMLEGYSNPFAYTPAQDVTSDFICDRR